MDFGELINYLMFRNYATLLLFIVIANLPWATICKSWWKHQTSKMKEYVRHWPVANFIQYLFSFIYFQHFYSMRVLSALFLVIQLLYSVYFSHYMIRYSIFVCWKA